MATIKVKITVEVDGHKMTGFDPLVRTIETDELSVIRNDQATGAGYTALSDQIADIKVLAVKASQPVTIRLNAQSDAGIDLNAGGALVIVDAALDSAAATNVTAENISGFTAKTTTIAGGT